MRPTEGLDQALIHCRGVGPALQEKLTRLGLHSLSDALFHLPLRYENRGQVIPIGELRHGQRAVINATVEHSEVVYRRKRMLLVRVSDGTGMLTLRFFHFRQQQLEQLKRGAALHCFGEAQLSHKGVEMAHPEYALGAAQPTGDGIRAIYPTTDGVHQATLKRIVHQALDRLHEVRDWLPAHPILKRLPPLASAIGTLHQPPHGVLADDDPARKRLALEELVAHHLSLLRHHRSTHRLSAPAIRLTGQWRQNFYDSLPFQLTNAQSRVIDECLADMAQAQPMQRLLQGDVGSGKTAVAAALICEVAEAGLSAALMAPTELLAEQHANQLTAWFTPLGIDVHLVSSNRPLDRSTIQPLSVFVGTHALFQDSTELPPLGLVIIDEQHRFGVHQRLALNEKGRGSAGYPHQLIMTATPIPRSLAMTAYADLDYSVIDELPAGRKPVTTVALPNDRRPEVIERIRVACAEGRQVYWVCTLIDDSEHIESQAAETTAALLREALPGNRVDLVHGQMKASDKQTVMQRFAARESDILVATTVIEVGVNVPNASLMIIENAERLGLAQLHQLRGRVGRGKQQSACVLLYQAPLGQLAKQRLQAMRESNDGFHIAQLDLAIRGPGEVLGTKQSGDLRFRVADLLRDQELLPHTQEIAKTLIQQQPQHAQALMQRWFPDAANLAKV